MASLALGLVGGFFGGPAGFLIGQLLGNLLFPQKVDGPRLKDLHLHTSSYGGMTPILYGTMRVAGNIDWQTDLTEHSSDSGGKGGPEVVTYTYSASFGVTLCEGPIAGMSKIWANGRKIYDRLNPVTDQDKLPITVYLGTEDQLPDPTMQTVLGAANVPAYRGLARVVFADWLLTDYSNTIPSLNFEVYTTGTGIPRRISSFSSNPDDSSVGPFGAYDATTKIITVSEWSPGNRGGYAERQWLLDGTAVSSLAETPMPDFTRMGAVIINSNLAAVVANPGTGDQLYWYYRGGLQDEFGNPQRTLINSGSPQDEGFLFTDPATGNQYVYTRDGISSFVIRYPKSGTYPSSDYDIRINSGIGSNIKFGASDNGKVYLHEGPNIYEYTPDLGLTHTWTSADFPAGFNTSALFNATIVRYNNVFAFSYANLGFDKLNLVSIAADNTLSLYPQDRLSADLPSYDFTRGDVSPLFGGYVLGKDGVTSLDGVPGPVTLADIVADLSRRAGLDDSQFDTSGLPDTVRGYLVTQQQAVRDDIDPLRQAYFFDGSEVDDKVVFVKRGAKSIVTIPDDDLAAYADGETPPPVLATDRAPEVDLPVQISVNYVNAEADYETGTQQAQIQTTHSQNTVTIDLSISLSNDEAKAIAQKHLETAWLERDTHSILVPRKYATYVPTDVITAHGKTIQVRDKTEQASGVIKLDGVPSLSGIFLQAPKSAGGSGFRSSTPGGTTATNTAVKAILMDMPLATDSDNPNAFYVGMSGPSGWPGGALYESSDGSNYSQVFSEGVAQVTGTTSTGLDAFLGGNIFDEVNTVTVVTDGGQLSGATETAVLNGANLAAIGSEFVQFKNATLTATNTYVLSGLLRGRRGTEWAMAHGLGEPFVLFPAGRVAQPLSEINLTRQFKPITFGSTVGSATAQPFANSGAPLSPYAPVLLGGGADASGNVTLNWVRRTRIGGAWSSFVDVPLSETSESYKVQIWNSDYTKCARIINATSTTTTYSSANQVSDFGETQQTIYFTVGQMGSLGIGYQARGTAAGSGSANDDPLAPISPYQSITSGLPAPSSLPQLSLSMGWANVRKLSSSAGTFNCSNIVVASFTTPSSTANGVLGWIECGEWVDLKAMRVCCLSSVAGDFSGTVFGSKSRVVGQTPMIFFSVGTNTSGYAQLSASTTYYFNVKNDDGNGVCTCLSGSCGIFVELSKPHGL